MFIQVPIHKAKEHHDVQEYKQKNLSSSFESSVGRNCNVEILYTYINKYKM